MSAPSRPRPARLLALIEDLLDYSKIEAGRFDPEPQPMSPREIADNVVELLAAQAFAKGIGLGCHVAPEVPQLITADPGPGAAGAAQPDRQCHQVHRRRRRPASPSRRAGAGVGTVRFSVADTGPGLRPQDLERIFEEFEQADGTSTRAHGGAGLGLAISKRLVDSMGGTISVTSDLGKGSDFVFEIPAIGATDAPQTRGRCLPAVAWWSCRRTSSRRDAIAMTDPRLWRLGGDRHFGRAGGHDGAGLQHAAGRRGDRKVRRAGAEAAAPGRLRGIAEAITLIAPTDRGMLGEFRASGYSTFLARPVRGETLLRVLLAGLAEPATPSVPKGRTGGHSVARRALQPGLSVLVAEDNEINAMLARATLLKAGHRVDVVGNGKAAVEARHRRRRQARYDVVLMDLHMPVMDGLDAIAAIRRHEEEAGVAPVPIMVLSADSQEKTRHAVLAHGASGFVTKPLDPDALVRRSKNGRRLSNRC